tara:strand:- start:340 stop:690 length:351 start_codon:yes stop_codon:yes gene_type:complete
MPRKEYLAKCTPEKKAKMAEEQRKYRKTTKGKKMMTQGSWRNQGLITDDIDAVYERYLNSTNCECCGNEYKKYKDKHMDHNHTTGAFRNILCRRCNQLRGHIEKDYKLIMKLQTMC